MGFLVGKTLAEAPLMGRIEGQIFADTVVNDFLLGVQETTPVAVNGDTCSDF